MKSFLPNILQNLLEECDCKLSSLYLEHRKEPLLYPMHLFTRRFLKTFHFVLKYFAQITSS